jgi:KDO2-lipid IV(A) lauroyltransferase
MTGVPARARQPITNGIRMAKKLNPLQVVLSHLAVVGLRVLGAVVSRLPPAVWAFLSSAIAPLLWLTMKKHRERALKNLTDMGRSPDEASALGRASFRSNLLVLFEAFAMTRIMARRGIHIESRISPEAEKVIERIRSGKEIFTIGVSGHTGVWEMLGAEYARLCAPTPIVISARLPKNPIIADYLRGIRRGFGLYLVEKDEFVRYLMKKARNKEPRVYIFLSDQHVKGGLAVPFMGRPACTVAIPATFHLKYGGPIMTGRSVRKAPGKYLFEIEILDLERFEGMPNDEAVHAITSHVNEYIEASINKAPEQWIWAHRRWRPCCEAGAAAREEGVSNGGVSKKSG